jgi:hypothetical protein
VYHIGQVTPLTCPKNILKQPADSCLAFLLFFCISSLAHTTSASAMALDDSTSPGSNKFPQPIDIPSPRRRSASESDSSSAESPVGPSTPNLPQSPTSFLSYLLGQSPVAPPGLSQSNPSPTKAPFGSYQNRPMFAGLYHDIPLTGSS